MELAQKLSTLHRMHGRFFIHLRPDLHLLSVTVAAVLGIAITNTALIWLIGTPFDLTQERKFNKVYGAIIIFAIVVLLNHGLHSAEGLLSRWTGLRFARRPALPPVQPSSPRIVYRCGRPSKRGFACEVVR